MPEELRQRTQTRIRLRGGTVLPQNGGDGVPRPARVGRYEIMAEIGKGAMGMVYKARDPLLDRVVALKTLLAPGFLGKEVRRSFMERFEREAKAAGRMTHPHIVTIYDVGLDHDNPYLVMEYVPGETLAARLDRGRIALPEAVGCAVNLAAALGYAHAQRIVHRDVKPANVLDAGMAGWKLADFGIARLPDSDLTQIGIFVGTPGYAPPEVVRGGRYTPAGDVFAWGAVAYELVSGQIPYGGEDPAYVNQRVLAGAPTPPEAFDASLPKGLTAVIMRAMAPEATARFASCGDAGTALVEAWQAAGGTPFVAGASPSVSAEMRRPVPSDFPSELPTELSERNVPFAKTVADPPGRGAAAPATVEDTSPGGGATAPAEAVDDEPAESKRRATAVVASNRRREVTPSAQTVASGPAARKRLPLRGQKRSAWPWILLILLMMAVAGIAAYVGWRMARRDQPKDPNASHGSAPPAPVDPGPQ